MTLPIDAPPRVYFNQSDGANAISIELRDGVGNRFGIGSRIVIHYGPEGAGHQLREIKASGGFLSMDPAVAHFGLAGERQVARIEVNWSTGEKSLLTGPFEAGYRYRITRSGDSQIAR